MSIFYFLPLVVSTLRLSELQNPSWSTNTNIMLFGSVITWGVMPFLFLYFVKTSYSNNEFKLRKSTMFQVIARFFSVSLVLLFILENKILSGSFLPIFGDLAVLMEVHTESIPGLGIFTRSSPAIVVIVLLSYTMFKSKFDLFLFFICFLLPITRGSRIEIFVSLIASLYIVIYFKVLNLKVKNLVKYAVIVSLIASFFIVAGNYRTSHGGEFEINIEDFTRYKGEPGPGGLYAWLYSYFCIPFEDLDRIISYYPDSRFYGAFSFSPILVGAFSLNNVFDIPLMTEIDKFNAYYTNPTSVPTALAYFYLDFGILGGLIPMAVYMLILLVMYKYRKRSGCHLLAYCLLLGSFSLSSFQAIMLSPSTFRMIILSILPFLLIQLMFKKRVIKTGRTHI
ncbi:MAG: oligosaccharide repeat unit polymerase [Chitinophagaceae bacterium]|nr:oligosaccharide repeat unit polymerase [Chitinophagaceae bacterium]